MKMYGLVLIIFALRSDPVKAKTIKTRFISERFNAAATTKIMGGRLINLTKSTYHDVGLRIIDMNNIRFMYEKTPFYEQGYVFSEIIERYKKMTENYRHLILFIKNLAVYDCLDRVEHLQKLYFEVFHLVNMMHEIPRKYQAVPEFKDILMSDEHKESLQKTRDAYDEAVKEREIETKLALLAENQAAAGKFGGASGMLLGLQAKQKYFGKGPGELGKMFPKRWPLDYGWEPEVFVP